VKRITVGDYPEGIAATADGKRIIVANWESNTLSIIDAAELKVTGEVKVGDGPRAFGAFLRKTE
jgi:YVTN family beta-propeller protein